MKHFFIIAKKYEREDENSRSASRWCFLRLMWTFLYMKKIKFDGK